MKKYKPLFEDAYKTWGKIPQVLMVVEEMAELQKELVKNINRNKDNVDKITEELADVLIVLEQLKIIYGISEETLEKIAAEKINKLKENLKNWRESHK